MSVFFSKVPEAPADPIFGLTAAFLADPRHEKINVSIGVYKDEQGNTPVLSCVKEAERLLLLEQTSKNYLPIEGDPLFVHELGKLLLGEDLPDGAHVGIQTVGGTGALRLAGELLSLSLCHELAIPDPSWPNHEGIFTQAGLRVQPYPYYDRNNKRVDFSAMIQALSSYEKRAVLLQVSCHNPSGADLTRSQWEEVVEVCKRRNLLPVLDAAYLGFVHSCQEDAFPLRLFLEQDMEFLVAVSCAKNFSLYAERVGCLFVFSGKPSVLSQLKMLARKNYSNPPIHGAKIVQTILSKRPLRTLWEEELGLIRARVQKMRKLFVKELARQGALQNYDSMLEQKGLFSLCGLSQEQMVRLKIEEGIYGTMDGRINLAALSESGASRVAGAIVRAGG